MGKSDAEEIEGRMQIEVGGKEMSGGGVEVREGILMVE